MKIILSDKIPKPGGHYSNCIEHNGILYLAGQLPFNPKNRRIPVGIKTQTDQVLQNIELILKESGSRKENILQMRIYIPDINLWDDVNDVYTEFMGPVKPVRCVIPTRELHFGCLIEIEVTAFI